MPLQGNDLVAGMCARDRHAPVFMPGRKELVVRAPDPGVHSIRMNDVRGRLARVGVPDLDCTILSPGCQAAAVGTKCHGTDPGLVPVENVELPSGARLPDVNRSVLAARGQLLAVGAPRQPPDPVP